MALTAVAFKLCSSLGQSTAYIGKIISELDPETDMIEVRVDLLEDWNDAEALKRVFGEAKAAGIETIATVREIKGHSGFSHVRRDLMIACVDAGATYVDLEVEAPQEYFQAVKGCAKGKAKLIVSHHNYQKDDSASKDLDRVFEECRSKGAEIVKVAVHVENARGAARVLSLYDCDVPVVAIGMGSHGQITRVAAASLGAPFSFVAIDASSRTAPGQLTRGDMRAVLAGMGINRFAEEHTSKRVHS